jgi:hypothetical protein
MTHTLKWRIGWMMSVLVCGACATNTPVAPTALSTSTSISVATTRLANSSIGKPTRTLQPAETDTKKPAAISPKASPTTRANNLKVYEIENRTDSYIETAFWSDDGNTVYYAFRPEGDMSKDLQWVAYKVTTHFTHTVSSPQEYDVRIWKQLDIPVPVELRGQISPSGKRIIYTVGYGSDATYATPDPKVRSRTEIWTADSAGKHRAKLTEFPGAGYGTIYQAAWLENETRIIFGMNYEYGEHFYIADLNKGTVVPLADVSGFKEGTEQNWAVSPDGSTLAVVAFDGTLWIASLKGDKVLAIEKYAQEPYWAKDGKTLYYWWESEAPPEFPPGATIHAYDMESGKITGVIDDFNLEDNRVPARYFAVAPHEDKIAFWSGGLWLVELPK